MAVQAQSQMFSTDYQNYWMINNNPDFNLLFSQDFSSQNFAFSSSSSSSSSSCDSFISMPLFHSLNAQSQELDHILHLQSEKLRFVLQQHTKELLKNMETKAINLIKQKEKDLAEGIKKSMELEACLKKIQTETELWQRLAREREAMVINLSNKIEKINNEVFQDSESFCNGEEDKDENEKIEKIVCKKCKSRESCVLFLPCKHLCSCKVCETFLKFCPVCQFVKEGSVEVFYV